MDQFIPVVGATAMLGSALVGGIFFTFSSFVMKALARVPSAEGIGAMQSINVVVLNPSFLGLFIGTAVVSLGAGGLAFAGWGRPFAPFFLGGALFYLVGTFLVTGMGNVRARDLDTSQSRYHVPPFCMRPKVYSRAATIAATVRTWFHVVHRLK